MGAPQMGQPDAGGMWKEGGQERIRLSLRGIIASRPGSDEMDGG
jgi:hypothetical protein